MVRQLRGEVNLTLGIYDERAPSAVTLAGAQSACGTLECYLKQAKDGRAHRDFPGTVVVALMAPGLRLTDPVTIG